jgi:hypothetical protein
MKVCTKCLEPKKVEDFLFKNKAENKRHAQCRECQKAYKDVHYLNNKVMYKEKAVRVNKTLIARNRLFIYSYLEKHPCVDCSNDNIIVLEFDHVTGVKRNSISTMAANSHSIDALQKEIDKCVVRCANCHRIKTAKERNWKMLSYLSKNT